MRLKVRDDIALIQFRAITPKGGRLEREALARGYNFNNYNPKLNSAMRKERDGQQPPFRERVLDFSP
jgi:hypothetical protein